MLLLLDAMYTWRPGLHPPPRGGPVGECGCTLPLPVHATPRLLSPRVTASAGDNGGDVAGVLPLLSVLPMARGRPVFDGCLELATPSRSRCAGQCAVSLAVSACAAASPAAAGIRGDPGAHALPKLRIVEDVAAWWTAADGEGGRDDGADGGGLAIPFATKCARTQSIVQPAATPLPPLPPLLAVTL